MVCYFDLFTEYIFGKVIKVVLEGDEFFKGFDEVERWVD